MKFYNKSSFKRINRKNLIISICIIILILLLIISFSLYIANQNVRDFFDIYLFKKNISSNNSSKIDFNDDESTFVFSYDKYIAVLNKNNFTTYNSSGNKAFDLSVELSSPIASSNNRFICLGENGGKKLYLINGQNIAWQKDIEGTISKVNVNKNGYVSIIVTGTSYKSVVITYDSNGKELFKTYLSSTTAIDSAISNDNKYLAIAEIDYSGTAIQSNIKILSIEKSQNDPTNAIDYIYPADSNSIALDINYNSKNRLVCMYDNSIHLIQNNNDTELTKISDKTDLFYDINLTDTYIKISQNSNTLFSDNEAHLVDISSNKDNLYSINGTPKSIYCADNTIAINLGSEIDFINNSGWLIKKFNTTQEAKNIVLGSGIAGVVYKNKVEIINL